MADTWKAASGGHTPAQLQKKVGKWLPWRSSELPVLEVCKQRLVWRCMIHLHCVPNRQKHWTSLVEVKDGHSLGLGPELLVADGPLMSLGCRTLLLTTLGAVMGALTQS